MNPDFGGLSDGELAALTLAGRQPAFAALMDRHRAPVYRLVRGHVGDADEALDVTQEAFVAAFTALDRYDAAQPMRAWLARIALNKCRDWGRRRTVRRLFGFVAATAAPESEVPDPAVPADAVAADRQALAQAWAAIARLPAALKEPLILHAVDGLSQAETGRVLGISAKAVETRVARARARLMDILPRR